MAMRIPAGTSDNAYQAVRQKLNSCQYFEPVSKESVAVVDRLLADVVKASGNAKKQRQVVDSIGNKLQNVLKELEITKKKTPQLMKENTDLHKQLLHDSVTQDGRRQHWSECVDKAQLHISHLRLLSSSGRGRVAETSRELAAATGVLESLRAQKFTSPVVAGIILEGGSLQEQLMPDECVAGEGSSPEALANLATQVADAQKDLAGQRRLLAEKTAGLAAAKEREVCTKQNQVTDRDLADDGIFFDMGSIAGCLPFAGKDALEDQHHVQVQALETEQRHIEKSCEAWRQRRDGLKAGLREAEIASVGLDGRVDELKSEISALRSHTGLLQEEIQKVREDEKSRGVAEMLEQREVDASHARVRSEHGEFESRLEKLKAALASKASFDEQRLESVKAELKDARDEAPARVQRRLEGELETVKKARRDFSTKNGVYRAKLISIRTLEESQEQIITSRVEEVNANHANRTAGLHETQALDSRAHALESALLSTRSETAELRTALEQTSAEYLGSAGARDVDERAESRLQGEVEEFQNFQANLATEVEEANAERAEVVQQARNIRQEVADFEGANARLRQNLAAAESGLAGIQRAHRNISAGVKPAAADLVRVQAEQQAAAATQIKDGAIASATYQDLVLITAEIEKVRLDISRQKKAVEESVEQAEEASSKSLLDEEMVQEIMTKRLCAVEPSMAQMRAEVARLAGERPRLRETVEARRSEARAAARISANPCVLQMRSEIEAALDIAKDDAEKSGEFETELCAENMLAAVLVRESECQAEARETAWAEHAECMEEEVVQEREKTKLEVDAASSVRRLEDLQCASSAAERGLSELQARQTQLVGLLHGLHSTCEQMENCLREVGEEVEYEKRLSDEALREPPALHHRCALLAEEAQSLRRTGEAVDADRLDLSRVAQERKKDVGKLQAQVAQLRAAGAEVQWTLDQLRHTAQVQENELNEEARVAAVAGQGLHARRAQEQALEAEIQEYKQNAGMAMDDLLHMSKENQLLHDQLFRAQQKESAFNNVETQRRTSELARQQELRGTEMECESAVVAYRHSLDERERNASAIAELAGQAERSEQEVLEAEAQLALLAETEHDVRISLEKGNRELGSLKGNVSNIARALEQFAVAEEFVGAERARMRHAIGTQQAQVNRAVMGRAAVEVEVNSISAETDGLQKDLQRMRVALKAAAQFRHTLDARQRKLQAQLTQQRQAIREQDVKITTLKCQLHSSAGACSHSVLAPAFSPSRTYVGRAACTPKSKVVGGSPTCASKPPTNNSAAGSPINFSPDASGLQTTFEEQGCLISEMTSERGNLEEEIARLKGELATPSPRKASLTLHANSTPDYIGRARAKPENRYGESAQKNASGLRGSNF